MLRAMLRAACLVPLGTTPSPPAPAPAPASPGGNYGAGTAEMQRKNYVNSKEV